MPTRIHWFKNYRNIVNTSQLLINTQERLVHVHRFTSPIAVLQMSNLFWSTILSYFKEQRCLNFHVNSLFIISDYCESTCSSFGDNANISISVLKYIYLANNACFRQIINSAFTTVQTVLF